MIHSTNPPLLRRMTPADVPAVLAIDDAAFPEAWDRREFSDRISAAGARLRQYAAVAVVASAVVGFVCYRDDGDAVVIERLAVKRPDRRRGIARALIAPLTDQLRSPPGRILAIVEAGNLPAQCLLRSCGFLADGRPVQSDRGAEAYRFTFDLADPLERPAGGAIRSIEDLRTGRDYRIVLKCGFEYVGRFLRLRVNYRLLDVELKVKGSGTPGRVEKIPACAIRRIVPLDL